MEGTYPPPEAQLDRFLFKLNVPFPSLDELADIVTMTSENDDVELDRVSDRDEIISRGLLPVKFP